MWGRGVQRGLFIYRPVALKLPWTLLGLAGRSYGPAQPYARRGALDTRLNQVVATQVQLTSATLLLRAVRDERVVRYRSRTGEGGEQGGRGEERGEERSGAWACRSLQIHTFKTKELSKETFKVWKETFP